MLEEARLAYVALRADDLTASPDTVWSWLEAGYALVPEARRRPGDVELRPRRQRWHVAFTPGIRALDVAARHGRAGAARRPADRGSISTRCAPRRPSRPSGCSPGCDVQRWDDQSDARKLEQRRVDLVRTLLLRPVPAAGQHHRRPQVGHVPRHRVQRAGHHRQHRFAARRRRTAPAGGPARRRTAPVSSQSRSALRYQRRPPRNPVRSNSPT